MRKYRMRTDLERIIEFLSIIEREPGVTLTRASMCSQMNILITKKLMTRLGELIHNHQALKPSRSQLRLTAQGNRWLKEARQLLEQIKPRGD